MMLDIPRIEIMLRTDFIVASLDFVKNELLVGVEFNEGD